MVHLKSGFLRFLDYLIKNTRECEIFFVPFGYLLIIGYLGFYCFNLFIASPTGYENFVMRLIVSLLGVGLVLHKSWMHRFERVSAIYWYVTLIYSLPFFFFFMLFNNPESNIWQINGLVGMATLTFFVEWVSYIVITLIGTILAYFAFYIVQNTAVLPSGLIGIIGSYSAPVIYLVLFSHRRKQMYKDHLLKEERAFNAKLLKKSDDLKRALLVKGEFLNNISHEVRTPINAVVNISDILVDHWDSYSEKERYQHTSLVAKSAKKLLLLMNNILDLSKFESDKMSLEIVPCNLSKVVRDLVEESELFYLQDKADVSVEAFIQPHVSFKTKIDSERISQVLRNLISNAIKFTPKGKITIKLQNQGAFFEIIVSDEGVGIPEEEIEDIFHSFVQSSRTKNKSGGTGLGLAISKEIIEAHKGKIWAENNAEIGSSFHVLLPKQESKVKIKKKKSRKILVIDDDLACHSILSLIFREANYEIISTYGGHEGLEHLKNNSAENIGMIFLDLMMPDMSGLDVLKEIKERKALHDIPVIIQSATHDYAEREKAFNLGAVEFIKKPYDRHQIRELLENHSAPHEDK